MMKTSGSTRRCKKGRKCDSRNKKDFVCTSLLRLKLFHGFQEYMANDGQAPGADLIQRVLGCVPVIDVPSRTVVQVNDIHGGHVAAEKRQMIVRDGKFLFQKDALVTKPVRRLPH